MDIKLEDYPPPDFDSIIKEVKDLHYLPIGQSGRLAEGSVTSPKWIVLINPNVDAKERRYALIEELLHIHYNIILNVPIQYLGYEDYRDLDELIGQKAEKIVDENPGLAENLKNKIRNIIYERKLEE